MGTPTVKYCSSELSNLGALPPKCPRRISSNPACLYGISKAMETPHLSQI